MLQQGAAVKFLHLVVGPERVQLLVVAALHHFYQVALVHREVVARRPHHVFARPENLAFHALRPVNSVLVLVIQ